VFLDGKKLAIEPGQGVTPHGIDRGLDPDELLGPGKQPAQRGMEQHGVPHVAGPNSGIES
jgi:hypothetical protein